QKDPLVEYKHEAYTMFVDLMNDIYNTFTERFLKVQLIVDAPPPPPPPSYGGGGPRGGPTKRYNAMGILEDIPAEDSAGSDDGGAVALDIGPAEVPADKPVAARKDPLIVGAGRPRSLSSSPTPANVDWSTVGRNDPCPCGSGKKFKKCHGAQM
ncbi:MAG: SEC-C metal-binding domain-containing protein, partial [Solirubrobacteraceae bacterium]